MSTKKLIAFLLGCVLSACVFPEPIRPQYDELRSWPQPGRDYVINSRDWELMGIRLRELEGDYYFDRTCKVWDKDDLMKNWVFCVPHNVITPATSSLDCQEPYGRRYHLPVLYCERGEVEPKRASSLRLY